MTIEPVLLPDGQVILTGKNTIVFLLNGKHLGGIGHQQAQLGPVCPTNIDGGTADVGMTVFLPCLGSILAIKADRSPPKLRLLWNSGVGGGPPIVAGGLVWTIAQNGKLYGLDPATGKVRQETSIGAPANHFPTPGIGAGLLLAPSAQTVIAFRTSAARAASAGHKTISRTTSGASRDRMALPFVLVR
jgi:outer membrane protein assembly factor BamB